MLSPEIASWPIIRANPEMEEELRATAAALRSTRFIWDENLRCAVYDAIRGQAHTRPVALGIFRAVEAAVMDSRASSGEPEQGEPHVFNGNGEDPSVCAWGWTECRKPKDDPIHAPWVCPAGTKHPPGSRACLCEPTGFTREPEQGAALTQAVLGKPNATTTFFCGNEAAHDEHPVEVVAGHGATGMCTGRALTDGDAGAEKEGDAEVALRAPQPQAPGGEDCPDCVERCADGNCNLSPNRSVYHIGCDGLFCAHGVCQECGSHNNDDAADWARYRTVLKGEAEEAATQPTISDPEPSPPPSAPTPEVETTA